MKAFILVFFSTIIVMPLFSQTISGVVNSYARVNSISGLNFTIDNVALAATETSVSSAFGTGRKVLVIQMKGVSTNISNTSSFGTITAYNSAGNYEFATVSSISGTGPTYNLTLTGLSRTYEVAGAVQIVSNLQYTNATVTGNVTSIDWDAVLGRGGIVVFEVQNVLTLSANITVNSRGFKGGIPVANSGGGCINSTTYLTSTNSFGVKGEGIADYAFNGITGQNYARGAFASGGGGGNPHNAGGGGGSNYGIGGKGGIGWTGASICSGSIMDGGGIGGYVLDYTPGVNKIFMGGGGGSGEQNNGTASRGGNGGGIIVVRAGTLTSTCGGTYGFYANGEVAPNSTGNDGAGGGGAGGTILLDILNYNLSCNVIANANGGNGGGVAHTVIHGGGGGGGTGAILTPSSFPANFLASSTPGTAGPDCSGCTNSGANGGSQTTTVSTGWTMAGSLSALPVQMTDLRAVYLDEKVYVQWSTLVEKNAAYFEVERSKDLVNIENIGRVRAAGNSNTRKNYKLTDEKPYQGVNYYRLKKVDEDHSYTYSLWVKVNEESSEMSIKIYPNPVSDYLNIVLSVDKGEKANCQVFDSKGQLVLEKPLNEQNLLDVSELSGGLYLVKIIRSGQAFHQKILIE